MRPTKYVELHVYMIKAGLRCRVTVGSSDHLSHLGISHMVRIAQRAARKLTRGHVRQVGYGDFRKYGQITFTFAVSK